MNKVAIKDFLISIKTGLNPRDNFTLNTPDARNWYITVTELNGVGVDFLSNTDRVNDEGLRLINNRSNLQIDDVLFSGTGSIGKTAIIKEKPSNWNIKEGVYVLKPNKSLVDPYYLLCLLQNLTKSGVFHNLSAGSTVFSVPMKVLENIEVVLPNLAVQKSISGIIKHIDDKIELNNKINSELESIAKLIYDYWFVQFDFPDENGKPYKSSGGKMVYNEELKREIPEGWEIGFLSSYISKDKSGDWGKEFEQGNYTLNVKCIRGADINGIKGQGELKCPDRYILPKNSHKIIETGDIVVEISGGSPTQSTARAAYINDGVLKRFDVPLISSNFCRVITLNQPKWIYSFFQEWHLLYDADFFFGWEGKTSGIKNFLFEQFLENYKTVLPPEVLLNKFNETVCDYYNKVQMNLLESQKLAELRDWLLPMLMNGQVTIKD